MDNLHALGVVVVAAAAADLRTFVEQQQDCLQFAVLALMEKVGPFPTDRHRC